MQKTIDEENIDILSKLERRMSREITETCKIIVDELTVPMRYSFQTNGGLNDS